MKSLLKRSFGPLFAVALIVAASPAMAKDKPEEQLINDLASSKSRTVNNAMDDIRKQYPNSSNSLPIIKQLLGDSRKDVRVHAVKVLGEMHSPVNHDDIKAMVTMLKEGDNDETVDVLKSMRNLQCQEAIPDIKQCLKSTDAHVLRDTCRTLAVVANKDAIPDIQPLLQYPDEKVQTDALNAINTLKAK